MISACKKVQGKQPSIAAFPGQFFKYDGLTCNFSEPSLRRRHRPERGGQAGVNTPQAKAGVNFLERLQQAISRKRR